MENNVRISVTLNDQASPGLKKVTAEIKQIEGASRRGSGSVNTFGVSLTSVAAKAHPAALALQAFGAAALAVSAAALKARADQENLINSLVRVTGSVKNATAEYERLFQVSRNLAGITGSSLVSGVATLRNGLNLSAKDAEALAIALGRVKNLNKDLNVQSISSNIRQLISEGFQISDVREANNQAPGFQGELLKQFGVKNLDELRKKLIELNPTISELSGKLTGVFNALGTDVASFSTTFEKMVESAGKELAPLGQWLQEVFLAAWKELGPTVAQAWAKIKEFATIVGPELKQYVLDTVRQFKTFVDVLIDVDNRFELIRKTAIGFGIMAGIASGFARAWVAAANTIRPVFSSLFTWIKDSLNAVADKISNVLGYAASKLPTWLGGGSGGTFDNAAKGFNSLRNSIERTFTPAPAPVKAPEMSPSNPAVDGKDTRYLDLYTPAGKNGSGSQAESKAAKAIRERNEDTERMMEKTVEGFRSIFKDAASFTSRQAGKRIDDEEERKRREPIERANMAFDAAQIRYRSTERSLSLGLRGIDQNALLTPEERIAARRGLYVTNADQQQQALDNLIAAQTESNQLDAQWIENAQDKIDLLREQSQGVDIFKASLEGFNSTLRTSEDIFRSFGQQVGSAFDDLSNVFTKLRDSFRSLLSSVVSNTLKTAFFNAVRPLQQSAGIIAGGVAGNVSAVNQVASFGGSLGNTYAQQQNFGTLAEALRDGKVKSLMDIAPAASFTPYSGDYSFSGTTISDLPGVGSPSVAGPRLPQVPDSPVQKQQSYFGGLLGSLKSSFTNPFTLAGIGSYLGGQSTLGNLMGAGAGLAAGWGISMASSVFSAAGGGLGALGPAALAAAGPLAFIAAPLVVGSILLGKAKQRKADEKVVDTYWVEYSRVLKELTKGVNSDRIMGDDALSQAAEARQTAVDLISQIKTKSVRESRLRNQIPQIDRHDLRNLQDAVAAQRTRLAQQADDMDRRRNVDSRLVPEFATGGVVPGPFGARVNAVVHAGEVVLSQQQRAVIGDNTLANAGVPGVRGDNSGGGGFSGPIEVVLIAGTKTQDEFYVNGVSSLNTRKATAQAMDRIIRYGG